MLITFRSKAWSNITMFGDVALTLLQMMGHGATVPGALLSADIPAALGRLEQALDAAEPETAGGRGAPADAGNPETAPPVGLRLRAHPLIQLLSAAALQENDVLWDRGSPVL